MKQRLSIARLLVHDPELLLLDEPASGLDPRARIEVRELFRELKEMGKTILISSHILSELASLCTMIGIIEAGKLIVQGSLDDVFRQFDIHRIVHVSIPDLTETLFQDITRIRGVIDADRQGDRISLKVKEHTAAPEELLESIHSLGAKIYMFQPEALDIETAFMKLTEGKLA